MQNVAVEKGRISMLYFQRIASEYQKHLSLHALHSHRTSLRSVALQVCLVVNTILVHSWKCDVVFLPRDWAFQKTHPDGTEIFTLDGARSILRDLHTSADTSDDRIGMFFIKYESVNIFNWCRYESETEG